jgi:hypothetical protein
MRISRRSALGSIASLGSLPAQAMPALFAGLAESMSQESGSQTTANNEFWNENIRNPESGNSRSISPNSAPRAVFVYYDPAHGFLTGSDIGDTALPDRGDAQVLIHVDHIRTSANDQKRFANLEGGSLRIDLQQQAALPSLAERLAWTAIAAILPESKNLPPLKEMTFDPGTTWGKMQTVPLPGGGGRWTWNFFLQHRKSHWMQLFDALRSGVGLASQIFGVGLPAMAITALTTVDKIVAALTRDSNPDWLFQSSDTYIYATKEARDSFEGSKLRLKQGMYIVLPSDQVESFSKQRSRLVVKDGLIVPANTSSLDVYEAAKEVIPDVTYLTVGVTVKTRPPAK